MIEIHTGCQCNRIFPPLLEKYTLDIFTRLQFFFPWVNIYWEIFIVDKIYTAPATSSTGICYYYIH